MLSILQEKRGMFTTSQISDGPTSTEWTSAPFAAFLVRVQTLVAPSRVAKKLQYLR